VASDAFVVPVVPQFLAVEGVQNLLDAVDRLALRSGGHAPEPLGIVMTMVDYRNRATRENVDLVRGTFGSLVFAVEIRVNVRLAEAPGAGKPIVAYDPSSTGARAYGLLAEELLDRVAYRYAPRHGAPAERVSGG
jgi:chromosome partitioning protein